MSLSTQHDYRFEVALSFAGDGKRAQVRAVAELLRNEIGDGKVFFDEWFEAELAGHDAHVVLQNIYLKATRLVVSCVCSRYNEKPWTQEEWRAIQAFERSLRDAGGENKKRMRLLLLRFGDGEVDGIFETALVPDVRNRTPEDIASLILKRLRLAGGTSNALEVASKHGQEPHNTFSEVSGGCPIVVPESEILDSLRHASIAVAGWPQTLPGGHWVERPELDQLLNHIDAEPGKPLAVLGVPGSGKSALLARLTRQLQGRGVTVLAVKADQLPASVSSPAELVAALQLREEPSESLHRAASDGKAVLIVDQLDALCDLIDLYTRRLDVVLALIARCCELKTIHVVLSSRTFEFSHDVRFKRLSVTSLDLELPSSATVDSILTKVGIEPRRLPTRLRDLLRMPQNLATFVDLAPESSLCAAILSQHALLELLWKSRVVPLKGTPLPSELAVDIAVRMGEREELWLPVAQYDGHGIELDRLVAAGILRFNDTHTRVGFAHQTIFEFCRARGFLRGNSLEAYVLEHQNALFVRPVMWSSLAYLRDADSTTYENTVRALLTSGVRRHVKTLVLEFLGHVTTPTMAEVAEVTRMLSEPTLDTAVLSAIASNGAWFPALGDGVLGRLMREAPRATMALLANASSTDAERVANALRQHWLPVERVHVETAIVLANVRFWTSRFTEIAAQLASSPTVTEDEMRGLLWNMARLASTAAPRVLVAFLRKMPRVESVANDSLVAGMDPLQRAVRANESRKPFEARLRWVGQMHCLSEIATRAPAEFVEVLLPWFTELASEMSEANGQAGSGRVEYVDDYSLETQPSESSPPESLAEILNATLVSLAETQPDRFIEFLRHYQGSQLMAVHRLFGNGIARLCPHDPESALSYLLEDPRRLCIRSLNGDDAVSMSIVSALPPTTVSSRIAQLEQSLANSNLHEMVASLPPEARRAGIALNRLHRLRLLLALPEGLRSAATNRTIEELQHAFPEHPDGVHGWRTQGMVEVSTSMSAASMTRAADKDIIHFFEELEDSTEWTHPRHELKGGSIQGSRAFGEFAKANSQRGANIIRRFAAARQERPAAYGIEGLAEGGYPKLAIEELVLDCDRRGFRTEEFRAHASRCLSGLIKPGNTLEASTVQLLESWLVPWTPRGEEPVEEQADKTRPRSILWADGGFGSVPDGNFPVLRCLTYDYLSRRPPHHEAWLRLLEEHQSRGESMRVWQALARHFDRLPPSESSVAFLERLFAQHPGLLSTREGAATFARASWWTPDPILQKWYGLIPRDDRGAQARGELVGLLGTRENGPAWATSEAARMTSGESSRNEERLGLSFSLAHLWPHALHRTRATPILKALFVAAEGAVAEALAGCFDDEGALADQDTRDLARCAMERPEILLSGRRGAAMAFVRCLTAIEPTIAAGLCELIVGLCSSRPRDFDVRGATELVDAAVTLQRLGEPLRSRGLNIFEELLELGVYDAQRVLSEVDGLATK